HEAPIGPSQSCCLSWHAPTWLSPSRPQCTSTGHRVAAVRRWPWMTGPPGPTMTGVKVAGTGATTRFSLPAKNRVRPSKLIALATVLPIGQATDPLVDGTHAA